MIAKVVLESESSLFTRGYNDYRLTDPHEGYEIVHHWVPWLLGSSDFGLNILKSTYLPAYWPTYWSICPYGGHLQTWVWTSGPIVVRCDNVSPGNDDQRRPCQKSIFESISFVLGHKLPNPGKNLFLVGSWKMWKWDDKQEVFHQTTHFVSHVPIVFFQFENAR